MGEVLLPDCHLHRSLHLRKGITIFFFLSICINSVRIVFRVCRKFCVLSVSSLCMAGRSVGLRGVVTFEKAKWLISTDHRSAGFFLPPSDFDAIENVYCNACIVGFLSKILQHVLHVSGLHVQTSATNVQRKIFIDFPHSFQTAKAVSVCTTVLRIFAL